MEKYLFCWIGAVFIYTFCVVCCHRFLNKKLDFKDVKFYGAILILSVLGTIITFCVPQYLKIFFTAISLFVVNYFFFCHDLGKTVLIVIMTEFILMICELIFVLLVTLLGQDMEYISNLSFGIVAINIGTMLLSFLCLRVKCLYKIFDYLVKTFNNMRNSNLIIYFIFTIVLISLFMVMSYMQIPSLVLLICNTVLTIFYLAILFKLANAQEKFRKVNSKYETSIGSLKEYEDIMDRYRVANHENKNELLTIRNMVKEKDKATANYIDKLVGNKIKDNDNILYKTSKIPEGGLRATIYAKLCKMDEMGINYILDIANDVRTVDLINLGDDTMLNICKIIGVFLDNAIEAVETLTKKEVTIELFIMDNDLCIDISNNYSGNLKLDEISAMRSTTKGEGHGYGLVLVTEILKKDKRLKNEKSVNRESFTQKLKIKM